MRGCILLVAGLLLLRALVLEPFIVPTGSMAPVLLGHHKSLDCPRCGFHLDVGHRETEDGFASLPDGCCPQCGYAGLDLDSQPICPGDQLLVNKTLFDWRKPRRWELAVFRCPADLGRAFVKRIVGLPGESVHIKDGDVFIDHALARKTLTEFQAVRQLVFDQGHHPNGDAVPPRWQSSSGDLCALGQPLPLDALEQPQRYSWLVYDHSRAPGNKAGGVRDEYPYNGTASGEFAVHDFALEGDLEVVRGDGWVALGITDGGDDLVVELPVGPGRDGTTVSGVGFSLFRFRGLAGIWPAAPGDAVKESVYRSAPGCILAAGRRYHVQLAFVDRRLTLAIDGETPLTPVDRPAPDLQRGEVERPVRLGASGAEVKWHNVKLYRDIHYTKDGSHGSSAPVRLGTGEYFVLGDNSPSSQDSRFWTGPDGQALPVTESLLVGKPFLVHFPSRVIHWDGPNGGWANTGLDWGRVRWLR